jgi:hypothetical protein
MIRAWVEQATSVAQQLAQQNGAVSLIDCSALILAGLNNSTLLAGDRCNRRQSPTDHGDCKVDGAS